MSNINNLGRLLEYKKKHQAEKPSATTFIVKVKSEGGGDDVGAEAETKYKAELGTMELQVDGQKMKVKCSKMVRIDNHVGGIQTFKCETAEPCTQDQVLWLDKFVSSEVSFRWKGVQQEIEFKDPPVTKVA